MHSNKVRSALAIFVLAITVVACKNPVATLQPSYKIQLVEQVNTALPQLHSHTYAVYQDKIIMIGGRTNGLHTGSYNLNIVNTNKYVYVIDTHNWNENVSSWTVNSAPDSIVAGKYTEAFRTNNAEHYTQNNVLYIIGGLRGAKTVTKLSEAGNPFSRVRLDSSTIAANAAKDTTLPSVTLPSITAVNLKELVEAVASKTTMQGTSIRHAIDSNLAVTGGELELMGDDVKLVFGWSFSTQDAADYYTHQIRSFKVNDNGTSLSISKVEVCPTCWDGVPQFDTASKINNSGGFRRRDGSMSAAINPADGSDALIYYAGVFKGGYTNFDNPVWITKNSTKEIEFVMRSNVYTCQVIPVYSKSSKQFYASLIGGMKNCQYNGDSINNVVELNSSNAPVISNSTTFNPNSIPYTNQITTLVVDAKQQFKQYLQADSFPTLKHTLNYPTGTIEANTPTFNGSESIFLSTLTSSKLPNGVIDLDALLQANPNGANIGYLHGGILFVADNSFASKTQEKVTFASNRIFVVKLVPIKN
jgi:hypothetical protein